MDNSSFIEKAKINFHSFPNNVKIFWENLRNFSKKSPVKASIMCGMIVGGIIGLIMMSLFAFGISAPLAVGFLACGAAAGGGSELLRDLKLDK